MMAKLSPHRTLSSLSLISRSGRRLTSARTFTTTYRRLDPTNTGNMGLAEKGTVNGQQANEPLTIESIMARRAKAGKLVAGTAAYADSDMFKSPQAFNQPKARRWDHHLTAESLARVPCTLKQAAHYLKKPGLISLGGGLPSAENFPIERLSVEVQDAPRFSPDAGETAKLVAGKHDVARNENGGVHDLTIALNYGQATGSAQLLRWVTEHTELVCAPPYADWRCALTIGSTGALEEALRMFCDRNRNDSLLTDEYSFSTAIETALPIGIRCFGVRMDEQGLLPESMDEILSNWDEQARGGARKPHVLYTVPSGQNPTGATQGVQRRRDIYEVCRKHDVFILEDEPYYFLQMQPYTGQGQPEAPAPANTDEFLRSIIPSLLSMDVDGRVMRMDSFSKVVVPGSRVGWVTASEQVIDRYLRHAEVSSQGPSGISQLVLYKLVDEKWGHEGYLQWLIKLRLEYTRRRNALLAACERHLPRDLISWEPPVAGMFIWLKVDHTKHPEASTKSILEIEDGIFKSCIEKGVLAACGSWFRTERDRAPSELFFRTNFASASEDSMDKAIERFATAVKESFRIS